MSIPDHAIGCLGSLWSPTYLRLTFAQCDHVLEIDAPPVPESRGIKDPANAVMHIKHDRELIELHQDIVETLIHTIDFMSINSAVLAPQPHGGFALVPKTSQVEFYTIQCQLWAPLIDIREVRTTRWCVFTQIEVRQGLWRGREIEFFVACGTGVRVAVQRYANLLQALNACGLDLCSPVIGHLVKDGSVIGVATEIHTGLATYADRALLYDAFQQLERENIFFKIELCAGSIYISDGKVRFGFPCASRMRLYSGSESSAFLEEARQIHWSCLDGFLSKLEDEFYSTFMPISWNERFRILAYIPTPERPILLDITLDARTRSKWVKHRRFQSGQSHKPLLHGLTNDLSVHALPFPSSYYDDVIPPTTRVGTYETDDDTPLPRARIELGRRPVRHRQALFDPYRRVSTHIRYRSSWSGDSDVTSESTPSVVELSPSP